MKITLNFPDSKAAFILELLRNLKFVSIEKTEDIPQWHKDILDERIAEYEKNPNDLIDWEDIQKEKVKAVI
jgi:Putative addiction module component